MNRVAPDSSRESNQSSVQSEGLTLGVVPPVVNHLKNSSGEKILKLCGESEWQPRTIIVTPNTFIITHPGANDIADQIPMVIHKNSNDFTAG